MDLQLKYQNLCNWLSQNGSWINPKMGIRSEGENGNGMYAKEALQNEELFKISNNCLINYENSKIPYTGSDFDNRQMTVVSLIYEMRNPQSFWKPYIELLPEFSSFNNHPIYLASKGQFPRVSMLINNYIDKSLDEFNKFVEKFRIYSNKNNFLIDTTYDEILYVYLLTISRMWTGIGLVPIADLLQHSNRSNISLNKDDNFSSMKSIDLIESGQPIYDNYLLNDDIMLFINFGFVENSDLPTIPINFIFDQQSPIVTKLISKDIENINKIFLTTEGINVTLMRYLRLNLLDMSDLSTIDDVSELGFNIINLSNEFKSLKRIKFRLSNYIPQEDLTLLNNLNYPVSNLVEKNIYSLLNRIFKVKETTNNFIKSYWSDLIEN